MFRLFFCAVLLLAGCEQREEHSSPPAPSSLFALESELWEPIDYGNPLMVSQEDGSVRFGAGQEIIGIRYTGGELPVAPYEISLDARRVSGSDFFCGLTFPVRGPGECATLILGGWGGGLTGLSSVDGLDASQNETTGHRVFENGRWYHVRVEVRSESVTAWIDGEKLFTQAIEGKTIGLRPGPIELCAPFGLASYQTTAEARNLRIRDLGTPGGI